MTPTACCEYCARPIMRVPCDGLRYPTLFDPAPTARGNYLIDGGAARRLTPGQCAGAAGHGTPLYSRHVDTCRHADKIRAAAIRANRR